MLRFFRLTACLFILIFGLGQIEAAAIPVLEIQDRVTVPGPKIYLSDLGTVRNASEAVLMNLKVDLGPAPYPGQVRVLSKNYLELILKQKGFSQKVNILMGQQVEVRVESTCITGAQLAEAIQQLLPQNEPSLVKRWIEFRNLPKETWLSKGDWQIKAEPLGALPLVGSALFRVVLSNGATVKTINVSGKIRAQGRVYQAVLDLKRHSLLNPDAWMIVEAELTNGKEFLGELPQAMRLTRSIRKGQILETGHLQPLPLVSKEDIVNVVVKDGNITIKMTGIAQNDGWMGEQIMILNPSSKKSFRGRVAGPNLVEVTL